MSVYFIGMKKSQKRIRKQNRKRRTVKRGKIGGKKYRENSTLTKIKEKIETFKKDPKGLFNVCNEISYRQNRQNIQNRKDNKTVWKDEFIGLFIECALSIIKEKTDINYYKNQDDNKYKTPTALMLAFTMNDNRVAIELIKRLLKIKNVKNNLSLYVSLGNIDFL